MYMYFISVKADTANGKNSVGVALLNPRRRSRLSVEKQGMGSSSD